MTPFEFTTEMKQIYEYPNHEGVKSAADPLLIIDLLEVFSKGTFNEQMDIRENPGSDALQKINAEQNICNITARAFNIPVFDPQKGTGATKTYLLALIDHFLEWQEEVKKKHDSTQT